jgi:predicted DNA binding CopG/RHH family protein
MKNKTIQFFSDDYLKQCKNMRPQEVLKFLDDFRKLHGSNKKVASKLISIKIPEDLLEMFKISAKNHGTPYQTQIKNLMKDWLIKSQKKEINN